MKYRPEEIVVAVDIGTTKICAVAGVKDEHGKWDIVGFAKVPCEGVMRGVVSNIEKTVKSIQSAVGKVEKQILAEVKVVHVGIAGQHIKSLQHHGILTRDNGHDEIVQEDIDRLIKDMHKLVLPPGDKILHVIPQEFTIDNEAGILEPIGMSGIRVEANFHIITGQVGAINNIRRCINKAGLEIADITLEPIASAEAVLSDEEKEAGIALVDIGGGTTDLTIFHEGIIRHTAVIPLGGHVVTKDIKEGCTIMHHQAEKLKVKFGSALADEVRDNRIITIPGLKGREPKEISEKNLALIIQARVEEIFDFVAWEIKRSGFENRLIGGIVLTGGGSNLKNIPLLVEYQTGLPTRIGYPIEHLSHGYDEGVSGPQFSTGIGLLIHGNHHRNYESAVKLVGDGGEVAFEIAGMDSLAEDSHYSSRKNNELEESEISEEGTRDPQTTISSDEKGWFDKFYRTTRNWFEPKDDFDMPE